MANCCVQVAFTSTTRVGWDLGESVDPSHHYGIDQQVSYWSFSLPVWSSAFLLRARDYVFAERMKMMLHSCSKIPTCKSTTSELRAISADLLDTQTEVFSRSQHFCRCHCERLLTVGLIPLPEAPCKHPFDARHSGWLPPFQASPLCTLERYV